MLIMEMCYRCLLTLAFLFDFCLVIVYHVPGSRPTEKLLSGVSEVPHANIGVMIVLMLNVCRFTLIGTIID